MHKKIIKREFIEYLKQNNSIEEDKIKNHKGINSPRYIILGDENFNSLVSFSHQGKCVLHGAHPQRVDLPITSHAHS